MVHVFCNLEEEEGDHLPMCDMTFEIAEKSYDQSTFCWNLMFVADATPLEAVGFAATIPTSGWHAQVDGEGDEAFRTYWGPVTLRSTGLNSDRLVALLADYYGVPHPQQPAKSKSSSILRRPTQSVSASWIFATKIECLCVGIMSDPARIAEDPMRMKLFFDEGIEGGRYAELFFNIDLPGGFAALNEKDQDYRADLIHWLTLPGIVCANPQLSDAP